MNQGKGYSCSDYIDTNIWISYLLCGLPKDADDLFQRIETFLKGL